MAELTTEQKAERYDAAIRRAKSKIKNDKDHVLYEDDVLEIFPELAEAYDERIRKALIDGFTVMKESKNCGKTFSKYNIPVADVLVWLEKQDEKEKFMEKELGCIRGYREKALRRLQELEHQGTQNHVWSAEDELCIRELESLVKQAWATAERGNDKETIHKMSDLSFFLKTLKPQSKHEWSKEDEAGLGDALWAIQQARTIAKDENDMGNLWYAENWLKTIKDRVQPKHAVWSDADEQKLQKVIDFISRPDLIKATPTLAKTAIAWLDSIKVKAQPRQEWNVKDEGNISILIDFIEAKEESMEVKVDLIDWLASFKGRYVWKPSVKQMNALDSTLQYGNVSSNSYEHLNSLFNDLKKLK